MYLEHCHPTLNHDIALMMALIAMKGNSINIQIHFLKHLTTIYIIT